MTQYIKKKSGPRPQGVCGEKDNLHVLFLSCGPAGRCRAPSAGVLGSVLGVGSRSHMQSHPDENDISTQTAPFSHSGKGNLNQT